MPVLLHQGHSGGRLKSKYGHPMYVDSAAADFPEVRFILGHGARFETWAKEAMSVAIYKTNVHLEISLWQHWASVDDLVRTFVWIRDRIGIDRLLFGSDMTNVEVSMSLKEWVDVIRMLPEWAQATRFPPQHRTRSTWSSGATPSASTGSLPPGPPGDRHGIIRSEQGDPMSWTQHMYEQAKDMWERIYEHPFLARTWPPEPSPTSAWPSTSNRTPTTSTTW